MSASNNDPTLWIDSLILALILVSECYVFYMLKFRLDFSGKLTLILHFLVSLLRLIKHLIPPGSIVWSFLSFECQIMVSFSLYYFVFEMRLIQITLKSESVQIYKRQKRFTDRLKCAILSFLFVNQSIFVTFLRLYIIYKENAKEDVKTVQIIFSTLSINKVILDVSMYIAFAIMFRYFWNIKKQKLRESRQVSRTQQESDDKLPLITYIVLSLIATIYALCILNTCLAIFQIITQFIYIHDFGKSWASKVLTLCLAYIIPFKDMLIALSFTWLYYHQGMKKVRQNVQGENDQEIQEIINITKQPDNEERITEDVKSSQSIQDEKPFVKQSNETNKKAIGSYQQNDQLLAEQAEVMQQQIYQSGEPSSLQRALASLQEANPQFRSFMYGQAFRNF